MNHNVQRVLVFFVMAAIVSQCYSRVVDGMIPEPKPCPRGCIRFQYEGFYGCIRNNYMRLSFRRTIKRWIDGGKYNKIDRVMCSGSSSQVVPTAAPPPPSTTAPPTNPPSPSCKCGKANRLLRIYGGNNAEMHEYPWQVGLVFGSDGRPKCGGSIVSSKTIVTAAHCTYGKNFSDISVLVAEHDLSSQSDVERTVSVCDKAEHPQYNPTTKDYDYATLTLCEDLTWTGPFFRKKIAPVCMPTTSDEGNQYENKQAIVSGWGATNSDNGYVNPDILQEVSVNTMTNSACCHSSTQYNCTEITSRMICASAPNRSSCHGDSGGPLVVKENNSYKLAGIVSWGHSYRCVQDDAPGVYARVTDQLSWLNNKIQGSRCSP